MDQACKDGHITRASFPQLKEFYSGKHETNVSKQFTFLMRSHSWMCQTE